MFMYLPYLQHTLLGSLLCLVHFIVSIDSQSDVLFVFCRISSFIIVYVF